MLSTLNQTSFGSRRGPVSVTITTPIKSRQLTSRETPKLEHKTHDTELQNATAMVSTNEYVSATNILSTVLGARIPISDLSKTIIKNKVLECHKSAREIKSFYSTNQMNTNSRERNSNSRARTARDYIECRMTLQTPRSSRTYDPSAPRSFKDREHLQRRAEESPATYNKIYDISTPRQGTETPDHLGHLRRSAIIKATQRRSALRKQREQEAAEMATKSRVPRENTKLQDFKLTCLKDMVRKSKTVKIMANQVQPFAKFRRVARAVKLLIQVCHVCKSLLADSVAQEAWFALVDNINAAAALTRKKKGRAFITFVPNENRELVQLSFDVTEFMRHKKAEDYLTDDIRYIMKQRPGTRKEDQILEVVKCMKGICKAFNEYPLAIQKLICQHAFYDKYRNNRVILRQGLAPDGIYFVLSGQLIEKPEGKKQPTEINAGEKFGEEDLVCGGSRRATVLTKHEVELLFLHRFDYRIIFNMSADSSDPKNLEICKSDAVFQHFPMQKLLDNPGTWSNLKYKYGRLIVKDSNELEWIYVIKSGEARVLKHLEPGTVDVKSRRKKIQQMMEEQSPYYRKKRILDFVADGNSRPSIYTPTNYHPGRVRPHSSRTSPAHKNCLGDPAVYRPSVGRGKLERPKTSPNTKARESISGDDENMKVAHLPSIKMNVPDIEVNQDDGISDGDKKKQAQAEGVMLITMEDINAINDPRKSRSPKPSTGKSRTSPRKGRIDVGKRPSTCSAYIPDRPQRNENSPTSAAGSRIKSGQKPNEESLVLPPFVQIETLHPGHTFGLRSCLEQDERGPSVSLVSGECEVLAINKKFFMKHCDDALYSLIRLKAKPFPSQTELVDRLDANMQWSEFKQETLREFLRHRVRTAR